MILSKLLANKNARVLALRARANTGLVSTSLRLINTEIKAPKDRLNPEQVTLDVGDYAVIERQFTEEDVK